MKDSFSNRLKKALAMRGMKQIELAEKAKLGRSAISQYVSGKYEPKQEGVYRIAKALNVSEAWLMGYDVPIERGEALKAKQNITFDDFTYAFHNETSNLTDAEKELLLSMARKLNEARKQDGQETD